MNTQVSSNTRKDVWRINCNVNLVYHMLCSFLNKFSNNSWLHCQFFQGDCAQSLTTWDCPTRQNNKARAQITRAQQWSTIYNILVTPLLVKLNNELLFFNTERAMLQIWTKIVHPPQPATFTTSTQSCQTSNHIKYNMMILFLPSHKCF